MLARLVARELSEPHGEGALFPVLSCARQDARQSITYGRIGAHVTNNTPSCRSHCPGGQSTTPEGLLHISRPPGFARGGMAIMNLRNERLPFALCLGLALIFLGVSGLTFGRIAFVTVLLLVLFFALHGGPPK